MLTDGDLERIRAIIREELQAALHIPSAPLSGEKLALLPREERQKAVKARVEELRRAGKLYRK